MSDKPIRDYPGNELDVHWDKRLCIHIGECGNANNTLFEGGRDPWCVPDQVSRDEVRDVCERCPSGALSYTDKSGVDEKAPDENSVTLVYNGPIYVAGELDIEGAAPDMPGVKFRAALCRCGASANKPFCDNSHLEAGFQDFGAVGDKGPGLAATGGPLRVKAIPNGPLMLEGNLTIRAGSGRVAWQGEKAFLCRCGASKNKPFCDGTHKTVGFTTE
ncbi:MAG: CDGSH iron-sulfur domain-containing protein [Thiohalocapsa sp.]